jgi:hypothetical protein
MEHNFMIKKSFGILFLTVFVFQFANSSSDLLMKALRENDFDRIENLLENRTPMSEEFIQALETDGRIYHIFPKHNATFLHYACFNPSCKSAISAILYNQLNVNAKDSSGRTPLHLLSAHIKDAGDCIRLLVAAGANVNAVNVNGDSVILYAIGEYFLEDGHYVMRTKPANVENAKSLIALGADVNLLNKRRYSVRSLIAEDIRPRSLRAYRNILNESGQ